ncbi:Uncharacterised protein [Yersinia pekkanenii]|uniref:Uncharacterized protein n=1 Tax=Yersinia pekkanenii TaxID=1288385 RepID=A0ABP2A083_9GAMM|nr:Uncharacterised protein [Yersinia pekkanenii]
MTEQSPASIRAVETTLMIVELVGFLLTLPRGSLLIRSWKNSNKKPAHWRV